MANYVCGTAVQMIFTLKLWNIYVRIVVVKSHLTNRTQRHILVQVKVSPPYINTPHIIKSPSCIYNPFGSDDSKFTSDFFLLFCILNSRSKSFSLISLVHKVPIHSERFSIRALHIVQSSVFFSHHLLVKFAANVVISQDAFVKSVYLRNDAFSLHPIHSKRIL